jgi:hypothetical protein
MLVNTDSADRRAARRTEQDHARRAVARNQIEEGWHHLEQAHVLAQPDAIIQIGSHLAILRRGIIERDATKSLGQVVRALLAGQHRRATRGPWPSRWDGPATAAWNHPHRQTRTPRSLTVLPSCPLPPDSNAFGLGAETLHRPSYPHRFCQSTRCTTSTSQDMSDPHIAGEAIRSQRSAPRSIITRTDHARNRPTAAHIAHPHRAHIAGFRTGPGTPRRGEYRAPIPCRSRVVSPVVSPRRRNESSNPEVPMEVRSWSVEPVSPADLLGRDCVDEGGSVFYDAACDRCKQEPLVLRAVPAFLVGLHHPLKVSLVDRNSLTTLEPG